MTSSQRQKKNHTSIILGVGAVVLFFVLQGISFWVNTNDVATKLCNHGIAFGIEIPTVVFVVMWSAVMVFILTLWKKESHGSFYDHVPFVLIVVGALSNIADRFFYGCVIDYINVLDYNTFNLADSAIVGGICLILVRSFFTKK